MNEPVSPPSRPAKLILALGQLQEIHTHGEAAYPEEGAGFLLGISLPGSRRVTKIIKLPNARAGAARRNRYLLAPQDYARAEQEAERSSLEVIGIFHSHPDHPDRPSDFDREWALPWFSYLITTVQAGKSHSSRSWRLREDRAHFEPEQIVVAENEK